MPRCPECGSNAVERFTNNGLSCTQCGHDARADAFGMPIALRTAREIEQERLAGKPVPTGIYWSREAGNFYDQTTNKGMGIHFYERWKDRKDEFPERATSAAGLDIYLSNTVIPS